jgi:hypothetical protein
MRGRLPFIVALATAAFLLQVVTAKEDTRLQDVASRADKLTAEAANLEEKIDERINPKRIQKAGSLRARVEALEESSCEEDHYQCGNFDPQCISNLLVCDGITDCRSGEDEKHCDVQLKKGDKFVGERLYDHCDLLNPEQMTITINSVTTSGLFAAHPKLEATLNIHVDKDDDKEISVTLVGLYNFATHHIIFKTPEGDNLYTEAQFDGYNFDKFIGDTVSKVSGDHCARFIFRRQH